MGIIAVWQASSNNQTEKWRRRRWKRVCWKCIRSDERSWVMATLLSGYRKEREQRTEGKTEKPVHMKEIIGWAVKNSTLTLFCALREKHSCRVRCCDSPCLTNHITVKGWRRAAISQKHLLFFSSVLLFHFLLSLSSVLVFHFFFIYFFTSYLKSFHSCPSACPFFFSPRSPPIFQTISLSALKRANISFTNQVSCSAFVEGMKPRRRSSVSTPTQTASQMSKCTRMHE